MMERAVIAFLALFGLGACMAGVAFTWQTAHAQTIVPASEGRFVLIVWLGGSGIAMHDFDNRGACDTAAAAFVKQTSGSLTSRATTGALCVAKIQ
jgi:hypothetical protein